MIDRKKIVILMITNNLTVGQLAEKIGISRQSMYRKLSNKTPLTITDLVNICEVFGLNDWETIKSTFCIGGKKQ